MDMNVDERFCRYGGSANTLGKWLMPVLEYLLYKTNFKNLVTQFTKEAAKLRDTEVIAKGHD